MENRARKKKISAAYRYCFSGLVLQLWLYCEERLVGQRDISREELAVGQELTGILQAFLERGDEAQGAEVQESQAFERLKSVRDRIIGRVEILTAFSDCFQIYEYVLNRVERRFVTLDDSRYTPEELASSLVETMAAMGDGVQRNGFLKDIVSQLPVRFTKKKFYAMVTERLTTYVGLNRGGVEDYLSMLRGSAMVSLPEGMEGEEELFSSLACLRQADYRNLDREGYERCRASFEEGSMLLTEKMDYYLSVEQMVNDLYVVFLTQGERMTDALEDMRFRTSAARILEALEQENREFFEKEEFLIHMEGIQEAAMNLVMAGSGERDEILDKVDRLLSGSHFMSVEPEAVRDEEADRGWIDQKAREFCQDMDGLFGTVPKAVARAVMAKVISNLPLVFRDSMEVEEYIRSSLDSCTDFAEREASMELLESQLREQRLMNHVLV